MLLLTWYNSTNNLNNQELTYLLNGLPTGQINEPKENPNPKLFTNYQW